MLGASLYARMLRPRERVDVGHGVSKPMMSTWLGLLSAALTIRDEHVCKQRALDARVSLCGIEYSRERT